MPRTPSDRQSVLRAVWAQDAPLPQADSAHLILFRHLRADWGVVESGAPGINPFTPLLGDGDTLQNAATILGNQDATFAIRTLAELGRLIVPLLEGATLAPGRYPIPAALRKQYADPAWGVDSDGEFHFTAAHLALLKGANWCLPEPEALEYIMDEDDCWPMPEIDGKRPYGDFSFFTADMARLLGEPYAIDGAGELVRDAEKEARLERLHAETLPALQIVFAHATLAP